MVIEPAGSNFSAYLPDVPGCVATGRDVEDCERNMRDALQFHAEGLREAGEQLPPATSRGRVVSL